MKSRPAMYGILAIVAGIAIVSVVRRNSAVTMRQVPIVGLPCSGIGESLATPLLLDVSLADGHISQMYLGRGTFKDPPGLGLAEDKAFDLRIRVAACDATRDCRANPQWLGGVQLVSVAASSDATVTIGAPGTYACVTAQ